MTVKLLGIIDNKNPVQVLIKSNSLICRETYGQASGTGSLMMPLSEIINSPDRRKEAYMLTLGR